MVRVLNIILGKSGHKNLAVDIDTLLVTRMLIQADSGGGKTWVMPIVFAFGAIGLAWLVLR